MDRYFKRVVMSLLMVYPTSICIYIAMIGRIYNYYQLSELLFIKMTFPVFLFAFIKLVFLYFGFMHVQKWCIKVAELIGMFEMFGLIISTGLFWKFEFLHSNAIRYVVVLPILSLINIVGNSYFLYSTWDYIIFVINYDVQNRICSVHGKLHIMKN